MNPVATILSASQLLPDFGPAGNAAVLLLGAPGIYLATVALGRLLKRRAGVRLGLMYKLFGVALGLYVPLKLLGWDINQPPLDLRRDLRAGCFLLAIVFILSLLRRYLWEGYFREKQGIDIPKFVREIFSVLLFVFGFLIVLSRIYYIHPSGVLLSSTVVVGIVGWAMQDLLGNVISGVALQIGKPFKFGDWLIIDNHHAEVIEVNWRSTRLRTVDEHHLDVPNTTIVRSTIVNLSYPSHLHGLRTRIGIAYEIPPNKVKAVLLEAALETEGVLATPAPGVYLIGFGDSAINYEIQYWIENHAVYHEIADRLHTSFWYALKRASIPIPFPIRTLQIQRQPPAQAATLPAETKAPLRQKAFFACLTDEQFERITNEATLLLFARGERIVEQGEDGDSMFILVSGEAAVLVHAERHSPEPTQVATLRAGDYFGEMSLLTKEKRSATVFASRDCEVLEITKPQLAHILQENTQLLKALSEMLAQRRLDNEGILSSSGERATITEKKSEYTQNFLSKLLSVFDM